MLESVVGKDFLPRVQVWLFKQQELVHFGVLFCFCDALICFVWFDSAGIVTRRPLVLQLHRIDGDREYAEFMHVPRKRFTDFGNSSILCLISKCYADDDIKIDA